MTDLRIVMGLVAAAGVAIGFGLVSLLRGNDDEPRPSRVLPLSKQDTAGFEAELAAIRDDLAFERSARIALAEEMERRFNELGVKPSPSRSKPAEPKPPKEVSEETSSIDPDSLWAKGSFSNEPLLALGVDPEEVADLRDRFEALELEERGLRDVATRDGWAEHPLYAHEVQAMRREFRDEIGDENYDMVLYAAGRSNRAQVKHVIRGSAAEGADIRAGDVIVSYAGERIFDAPSVFELTTQAEPGESTRVEVLRDGEIIYLTVARGPMGANFERIRVPPGS